MKRIIFIVVALLALLFIGCGKSKEPTVPDFPHAGFEFTGDYMLLLLSYKIPASGYLQAFSIQAKQPINTITINNAVYELEIDEIDEETGYYNHFLEEWFENPQNHVAPDAMFNYSFRMGGKSYSGYIRVPQDPNMAFPAFDFDQDYTFFWNTLRKPHFYLVEYSIWSYALNYSMSCEASTPLKNTAKKYTIPKSYWKNFNRENLNYKVDHAAMNYLRKDDNLAISMFVSNSHHNGPQEKGSVTPYSKAKLKQNCEQLFKQIHGGKIQFE